jgi:hypothetical protein
MTTRQIKKSGYDFASTSAPTLFNFILLFWRSKSTVDKSEGNAWEAPKYDSQVNNTSPGGLAAQNCPSR